MKHIILLGMLSLTTISAQASHYKCGNLNNDPLQVAIDLKLENESAVAEIKQTGESKPSILRKDFHDGEGITLKETLEQKVSASFVLTIDGWEPQEADQNSAILVLMKKPVSGVGFFSYKGYTTQIYCFLKL